MSAALIRTLAAYTNAHDGPNPWVTPVPGVVVVRADEPKQPMPILHKPALCLVAQGAKQGLFGETHHTYRAGQALIVGIETPAFGWVSQASAARPFLGLIVGLDLALMREVLATIEPRIVARSAGTVFIANVGAAVDECARRLVELAERPHAIATIAPLIMRELSYWLLTAPYGDRIAGWIAGSRADRGIVAAVHDLRRRFAEPVRVEELAAVAQMSVSTFHRQFKTVTSMSPLQYQKQLRLLEARHLMADGANAETAAFRVGYESQSQFSREFSRLFGAPPRRAMRTMPEAV